MGGVAIAASQTGTQAYRIFWQVLRARAVNDPGLTFASAAARS